MRPERRRQLHPSQVAGQTASTYTLVSADIGATVYSAVQAHNSYGWSAPASSNSVGPIPAPPGAPSNSAHPAVTGSAQVGATLTVTTGTWTGSPNGFEYEWLREYGGVFYLISGQGNSTYTVTTTDVAYTIYPAVRAHNGAGWSGWYGSDTGIGPIPALADWTVRPHVSGSATIGATLTVTTGTWSHSPDQYAYQWLRCQGANPCTTISNASSNSYVATSADIGDQLTARVQAHNAGGWSDWVSSDNAIGPVGGPASPVNTTAPHISGSDVAARRFRCRPAAGADHRTPIATSGGTACPRQPTAARHQRSPERSAPPTH